MARRKVEPNQDALLGYLKNAGQEGIINLDSVWKTIVMTNREKALAQHKYAITQGSDGNWKTYVYDPRRKNNRRPLKRRKLEDLQDELVKYYINHTLELAPTLRKVYPEWLDYFILKSKSTATVYRTVAEWNRWYKDSDFVDIPLMNLRKIDFEKWVLSLVKDNNMTKKQYYNATHCLKQMMEYCDDTGIIEKNPYEEVTIDSNLFRKEKKPKSDTQVFTDEEMWNIILMALDEWNKDHEIGAALALAFVFFTGVRPGEVVAFKKSDIVGKCISVTHAEQKTYRVTKDPETNDVRMVFSRSIVSEDAKSEAAYRDVYVTEQGRQILELALETGPKDQEDFYLFRNNGVRCNAKMVSYRLDKYCKHLGIRKRSPNKIRKTYISRMIDAHVNINSLREQVGHEDERTTFNNYCYDRNTQAETNMIFEHAFQPGRYEMPEKKSIIPSTLPIPAH